MYFGQKAFDLRCEWGSQGILTLAPQSDVVIIVDVLSFSTSVDIAVSRGASVFPYRWKDDSARVYAESVGAVLAGDKRSMTGYSLSPTSLQNLPKGTCLVLPSPNGSSLSLATGAVPTLAGCLRNAIVVALAARKYGNRISVIPAGERWREDDSLRPALEDLLGAGAILSHLPGTRSPEAEMAIAVFQHFQSNLLASLQACGSGKELIERGFAEDVVLAADLDVSTAVPLLTDGVYINPRF